MLGRILEVSQIVNILPHQRADLLTKHVQELKDMHATVLPKNCSSVCATIDNESEVDPDDPDDDQEIPDHSGEVNPTF